MTLILEGRTINRLAVIDDDASVRASYIDELSDLGIKPVEISTLQGDLNNIWETTFYNCDAVLTDLILNRSGYAPYNGGTLAVECKHRKMPAIICTSYSEVNQELTRSERRHVAAILQRKDFNHKAIMEGLKRSIAEIEGHYTPERRPWRTQIEIVDADIKQNFFWVIIIGRDRDEKVKLYRTELPIQIRSKIQIGLILYAKVNSEAKSVHDLYFDEWELNLKGIK